MFPFYRRKIQNDENGHCSIEDAKACMELVQLKIKNGTVLEFSWISSSRCEPFFFSLIISWLFQVASLEIATRIKKGKNLFKKTQTNSVTWPIAWPALFDQEESETYMQRFTRKCIPCKKSRLQEFNFGQDLKGPSYLQ